MEFRILGPLEISGENGRARPRGARQQVLLSALLMQANRVVPVEQLIDSVWSDDPPETGAAAVYTLVSRLRQVLATAQNGADERLSSAASGYRLQVEPGELDLERFRDHLARGRMAAGAGRLAEAAVQMRAGLAIWRGRVLDGLPGRFAETHATRLQEEHLVAIEERIGVDLALGKHTELTPELRALLTEHPLRERLHSQLMLALFQAGQQAEALQAFQDARRTLIDVLGIEPGRELQDLHQRILYGDSSLSVQPIKQDTRPRRNNLPADIADFTGRESELRRLLTTVSSSETATVISAVNGMAGIGKTALAVHAAHQLTDRYPDAQLFIDLHAHTTGRNPMDPFDALEALLGALGVAAEMIPDGLDARAAMWRAELANRRVLVVLDNAADAAQVRPLIPGSVGCLTLITSRRQLIDLDSTRTLALAELSPDEANAMFAQIVGTTRAQAEADAATEVVRLCGYLPLAIRIAAARLHSRPSWTIAYLAQRLQEGRRRLAELSAGDSSVAAVFELSYRHLTADEQRLFRLLGLHAGADLDVHVAAAVTRTDLDKAERLLEDLVDVHLLQQPAPGRYKFHDLLRQHAHATASAEESDADRHTALTRLLDYYLHTAELATRRIHSSGHRVELGVTHRPVHVPDLGAYNAALAWLETERDNLTATVAFAAEHGWYTHAWQIPHSLWYFFLIRGHFSDWISTHQLAVAATRQLGDPAAEAETVHSLTTACWRVDRTDEAFAYCNRALELYRTTGDRRGEGQTHNRFGVIHERLGQYDQARECYERALPLAREAGDLWTEAVTVTNLGVVYALAGKQEEAFGHYREALSVVDQIGDPWVESCARTHLGAFHRQYGRYSEAVDEFQQALTLKRDAGDRAAESGLVNDLAETYLASGQTELARARYEEAVVVSTDTHDHHQRARAHAGIASAVRESDPDTARDHWRQALEIFTELGAPEASAVRRELDQLK